MTITTQSNIITAQGNGANTVWPFSFLIPQSGNEVVTLTELATGATQVLDSSVYSVTGFGVSTGGSVTYPLSGTPLSSLYNLTIQRILTEVQQTDLVNQSGFYPDTVEGALDYLTMLVQQLQEQVNRALAFPVGASATSISTLMTAILNASANAIAAGNSAAAAAASAAAITALLPLQSANIGDGQVTAAKIASNSITALRLATSALPQVAMLNGTIVESHASNAVTIAVKTLAGADPSVTDPVYFLFRSPTAGSGSYLVRTVTAALSLTLSAGSTIGFANGIAGRLWITAFDDAATVRLAAINVLSGVNVYSLAGFGIASTTAEGGAGGADSSQVFYSGTAVASKAFSILGYMTWETGLAVAGNWATSPTRIQLVNSSTPLPGQVLQTQFNATGAVATGGTVIPYDDTIPANNEGDQYMSQGITPSSAANLLDVEFAGTFSLVAAAGTLITGAIFQDAIVNAIVSRPVAIPGNAYLLTISLKTRKLAGQSTLTTFYVRVGPSASATITFNGSAGSRYFGGSVNSFLSTLEIVA